MSPGAFESDTTRTPERAETLTRALAQWRRELGTFGGPNTLLWSAAPGGPDAPALDLTTAHPGGVSMLLAGRPTRLSDLVRERAAFAEARSRAAAIRDRAVRLREERGLRTCFLTAGVATWEHPGAPGTPQAPLLLRSCELRPIDPSADDYDVVLSREVELNPVLEEYLRSSAGIDVDGAALADMSMIGSGFDPYPVYAALGRLAQGLPGFTITPRMLVGLFPHGKLAMVGDLVDLAAPAAAERLAGHPVLVALAARAVGGADVSASGGPVEPPADLDPDPDPTGERLVLDADAAQGAVVEAVLRGEDLLVDAPPGTGATQTVANVVAAVAGQGGSVLLVAERRGELDAVRERLGSVGLGGLVVPVADDLFDHRGTLRRLAEAVDPGEDTSAPERGGDTDATGRADAAEVEARLRHHRDLLRDHVAALHEVRVPWGVSAHEVQCAISELASRTPRPTSRVRIRGAALARLSRERLHELADELAGAVAVGAWAAGRSGDPWYGARITDEADVARASTVVQRLAEGVDRHAATLGEIMTESRLPEARTVDDWRTALTTMTGVRDTLEVFRPEIFDVPLDEHVAATGDRAYRQSQGVELGWVARSRVRRLATGLLRPGRPPEDLHAELVRARTQRAAWHALVGAGGRPEISPRLDEAQDAYAALEEDLVWLGERLAPTADGGDLLRMPIEDLRARIAALADAPERLAVLPAVTPVLDDLRAAGMGEVVDDFAARGVETEQVTPELEHIWWVSIARHVAESDARYGQHDGGALRAAADAYRAADREHLAVTARRTAADVAALRVRALEGHRQAAAMVRGEADRPGRPPTLRATVEPAADLLRAAAPCWAMSPHAVGEALPPGSWFDVVVVAGAGTVTTAGAVSALSRARQVVAVGDLSGWPTGLTGGGTSSSSLAADLDGLLPRHRLGWAHALADGRLGTVAADPAARDDALVAAVGPGLAVPVTLEVVDGRANVEPGEDATIDSTDAEVDRVVALVLEHGRRRPDESLAVVALTERHAARVRDALAAAVRDLDASADGELLARLDVEAAPPVVVVPLSGTAGLARDAVLLAVGYGRTTHGRVLHRFPSLGGPDAGRRLRAAVGAARRRLTVVTSIAPEELDADRLRDGGPLLRGLLLAAQDPAAAGAPVDDGSAHPDPLLSELAARLRREGLVVGERVGVGPRRIDLAVTTSAHADRWLVAVDGDGPGYATSRGTRERDRLWAEELERRGWQHLRVWSTDLYRDPARDVARIITAVRDRARRLDGGAPVPEEPEMSEVPEMPAEVPSEAPTGPSEPSDPSDPSGATDPTEDDTQPVRRPRRAVRPGTAEAGSDGTAQTADDTDAGWGERPGHEGGGHDRWLEEQRPPHWE